jgi:uncharacterized membrane protein
MRIALFLHLFSAVVWVGGMFFAYLCLRPVAASVLEPPQRLTLWSQVFARFFPWVWVAAILLPVTGLWIIFQAGGFGSVGHYVHIMLALGVIMIAVFGHVYFSPYRRLRAAVAAQDFATAGKQLAQIRILVAFNLTVGILIIAAVRLLR